VRLLRTSGADLHARDATGCVPASYCLRMEDDVGAVLRAELLDPALEFLIMAARKRSEESCSILQYAGVPGYLTGRQCLDVHNGDHWTPLFEAIACGNLAFATALIRQGADPHRTDRYGLSALFWAQALHGPDAVAQLIPQQHLNVLSSVDVNCKDGVLRVSAAAHEWMEGNFPAVAAAAVPCATLVLTLESQGFQLTDPAPATEQAQDLLTADDAAALLQLQTAQRKDIRDAMVLEMHFNQCDLEDGFTCAMAPDQRQKAMLILMEAAPKISPKSKETTQISFLERISKMHVGAIVDFLSKFANDPCLMPQGPHELMRKFASARHKAISITASKSKIGESLSLQQLFLLQLMLEQPSLLKFVNDEFATACSPGYWAPLAANMLDAVGELPVSDERMFYHFIQGSCDSSALVQGDPVVWPGFIFVTTDSSAVASPSGILVCIEAATVHMLSPVCEDGNYGVLLPDTPLYVVNVFDVGPIVRMELRGTALQS